MRLPGWERRFAELIESARDREWAWGTWDCCMFVCAAIQALTGKSCADAFAGRYRDRDGAEAILAERGGLLALAEEVAAKEGFAGISVTMARRGDVVLSSLLGRHTFGVCVGDSVAYVEAAKGLLLVPITSHVHVAAWRIA